MLCLYIEKKKKRTNKIKGKYYIVEKKKDKRK